MLKRAVFASLACLLGCDQSIVPRTDITIPTDLGCPAPPDMATPPPKCAAAKGLVGDNLLCVDFKDVQMLSSLGGWTFSCVSGTLWSTANKVLEVNNFSTFMSTCTAILPALSAADYQKYSSFTLSVIHAIDINPMRQSAGMYLGAAQPGQTVATLPGTSPRQRQTHEIAKTALPNGGSNAYQPLFQITSSAPQGGYMGWQIESIAINGIP